MKQQIVILACICSALVYALPVSNSDSKEGLDIVQIPLNNNKELDILSLEGSEGQLTERNKRTIGILRDLFPELSKQIEDRVNQIIGQVIRAVGPTILRTAIQGNRNSARNDFDADFDDDDDDSSSSSGGARVQIDLPTFSPDDDDENSDSNGSSSSTTTTTTTSTTEANNLTTNGDNSIDLATINQQLEETIRVARQTAAAQENSNSVSSNEATSNSNSNTNDDNNTDQIQQASESKAPAIDELTLDNEDDADDRNKRFLNLGFGGTASAGGGSAQASGSVAGSGNFLFDIIRRTADRAARAAGTVYRVVAGTETFDLNNSGTSKLTSSGHANKIDRTARTINDGLFSGSITPQGNGGGGDERATDSSSDDDTSSGSLSASADVSASSSGGYTEGIPGPVTRLVVLANRGLANLIQDLILRIAATSERLVNFKARLITALI